MNYLRTLAIAAAAASLALGPSAVHADADLAAFNKFTAPGNLMKDGGFDQGTDIKVVGGTVIVMGYVMGKQTLKVIEYSGDGAGTGTVVDLGTGLGSGRDPIGIDGGVSVLVESVPKEDCAVPNEPVLYTDHESEYQIKWCRKFNANPKWAKKNYYYQFSSGGSPQLVATVKYRCEEDGSLMPPGVWSGSCQ